MHTHTHTHIVRLVGVGHGKMLAVLLVSSSAHLWLCSGGGLGNLHMLVALGCDLRGMGHNKRLGRLAKPRKPLAHGGGDSAANA